MSFFSKLNQYVKDSRNEFKKVIWPSREEVTAGAKVIIASVILFSIFFGLIDYLLVKAMGVIFR